MQSIFAQDRGFGVKVTDSVGKSQELYKGSYALVIGESDYQNPPWSKLPGVKDDVVAVKASLEKQGFTVQTHLNPSRRELLGIIEQFVSDYGFELNNRLVFYFAGHGDTQKAADGRDLGYLVPADAPSPSNKLEFLRKAITMNEIEAIAEKIQSKHALFIFDSCFSGTIFSTMKWRNPSST